MGTTFKEEIKNYLELVPDSNNIAEHTAVDTKNVQHKCSNDPSQVRNEVEMLRKVWLSVLHLIII